MKPGKMKAAAISTVRRQPANERGCPQLTPENSNGNKDEHQVAWIINRNNTARNFPLSTSRVVVG